MLKDKGYQVSLALMATKPDISYLSTLIRYEEMYQLAPKSARATSKDHHDLIVKMLVENLRKLDASKVFERIEIFDRNRGLLASFPPEKKPDMFLKEHLLSPFAERETKKMSEMLSYYEKLTKVNAHLEENNSIIEALHLKFEGHL